MQSIETHRFGDAITKLSVFQAESHPLGSNFDRK